MTSIEELKTAITTDAVWQSPIERLRHLDQVAVYGAGGAGEALTRVLGEYDVEVLYYIDSNKDRHGEEFLGKQIVGPEQAFQDRPTILIGSYHARDIGALLKENGATFFDFSFAVDFPRWNGHFDPASFDHGAALESGLRYLADDSLTAYLGAIRYRQTLDPTFLIAASSDQYYHEMVHPRPGDVYIDGGAWQGDTVAKLNMVMDGDIDVHSFEPDEENVSVLEALVAEREMGNVTVVKQGLWNKRDTLRFLEADQVSNTMETRISNDASVSGGIEIEVTDLDGYRDKLGLKVGFVKLDIEGAELNAIDGMRTVLTEDEPHLALSIYHEPNDLSEIMEAVKSVNASYAFYFAHHSQNLFDSVLYARVT